MITASRPDKPSRVFALFGDISDNVEDFDTLCSSGQAVVLREDVWVQLEAESADAAAILQRLNGAIPLPLRSLTSFDDGDTLRALKVARGLGLIDARFAAASEDALNKGEVYRRVRGAGVHIPDFVVADDVESLRSGLASFGVPIDQLIVKPVGGTGSEGVYRPCVRDSAEYIAARVARGFVNGPREYLVMPYLAGSVGGVAEFCADGLCLDGSVVALALGEKIYQQEETRFADRMMVYPPVQSKLLKLHQHIREMTAVIVSALSAAASVFHIEFRVDDDAIIPIDVALRPGGGLIPEAVQKQIGMDLRLCHVLCSAGDNEHLRRMADAAVPPQTSVAIGAFYSDPDFPRGTECLQPLLSQLHSRTDLLRYHLTAEVTDMSTAEAGISLSLAIEADTPRRATSNLREFANDLRVK